MRPARADMVVTKWGARFGGRRFPCAIGRGGIQADKVEGDGVSPVGFWRLVGGGYRADRMARRSVGFPDGFCIKSIRPFAVWSDDNGDQGYNHLHSAYDYPFSHEKMRRADPLYDVVLYSDWNWPKAIPGKGSAIFVHHWRRPRYPTEGCIAFAPKDLRWILARWEKRSRIFVT